MEMGPAHEILCAGEQRNIARRHDRHTGHRRVFGGAPNQALERNPVQQRRAAVHHERTRERRSILDPMEMEEPCCRVFGGIRSGRIRDQQVAVGRAGVVQTRGRDRTRHQLVEIGVRDRQPRTHPSRRLGQ